jgi:putative transcriptional regulator
MTVKDGEVKSFLCCVSENVKRIRKEKGYSTLDTANALGHSSLSYVNRIERGENSASYSLAHLYILSKEWSVDISEFFKK